MKRNIITILVACIVMSAAAREVRFTKPTLKYKKAVDSLEIEFKLDVAEVEVGSTMSYVFTPVFQNGINERYFPPVVVADDKDYEFSRKERNFARKHGYTRPYTIVAGRDASERDNIVTYSIKIPFEPWYENSSFILLEDGKKRSEVQVGKMWTVIPMIKLVEAKPNIPKPGEFSERCMQMVSFLTPEEEPLKVRSEQSTLFIQYPTGSAAVDSTYKNNRQEIDKLQGMMKPIVDGGDLVTLKGISVIGYASPDGSAKSNDALALKRAQAFANFLSESYHLNDGLLKVSSKGEDWDLLINFLKHDMPDYATKALSTIEKYSNLDTREAQLKKVLGVSYRSMVDAYYSKLRRLTVEAEYEIREVLNTEAATLIYTNPRMLSLKEIYSVVKLYTPGTKEYKDVYMIAAENYPADVVANINAASACIASGDFDGGRRYMERVKEDKRAYNNLGVLAWLSGDFNMARAWFKMALEVEPEKAESNLKILDKYQK